MTGWIILTLWPVGWLTTARMLYRQWRPYTEPLSCTTPTSCTDKHYGNGKHYESCYARVDMIDTPTEAYVLALLSGLVWPAAMVLLALRPLVTGGRFREVPAERDAKIKRLEKELEIEP